MLPDEYEEHFRRLYERTVLVLTTAGCDGAQARSIARERVLQTAQAMSVPDIVVVNYPTDGETDEDQRT